MPLPAIETIQSDRLSLRPVEEQDLPDLPEINGDPEVTRFLAGDVRACGLLAAEWGR